MITCDALRISIECLLQINKKVDNFLDELARSMKIEGLDRRLIIIWPAMR